MTIIPTIPFFGKRKRAEASPPIGPLTLVSAIYNTHSTRSIALGFSRAIDISAIVVNQFTVIDSAGHKHYRGTGSAVLDDDVTVRINLVMYANIFAPSTTLSASDANGIVAAGDGDAWDGVSDLGLPYP